jgi:hypothetical protein
MNGAEGQTISKQRAPPAEFPDAWIKTKLKLRRFSTRGLDKVRCAALWAALTFNLQRMVSTGVGSGVSRAEERPERRPGFDGRGAIGSPGFTRGCCLLRP